MKLKPYPKYKDSGIKWIGEIPEGWEVRKLKFNYEIIGKTNIPASEGREEGKFPFFTSGESTKYVDEPIIQGEFVVVGDGGIPNFKYYNGKFSYSDHCFLLKSYKQINLKFLFYFLIGNLDPLDVLCFHGMGLRNLDKYNFNSFLACFASLIEQNKIVSFLYSKTSEINRTIEKDKKLIALLKEKRTALINHAVTKGLPVQGTQTGLDPNVKLKDSGIEWIGEIPEGWETRKLKFMDFVVMGQSPDSEDYNYENKGFPFLQGNAEFTELNPKPVVWCETTRKMAIEGDILLSVRAPIGAINIADRKYGIGRGLCAIRCKKSFYKFLFYQLVTREADLNSIGTGSTYSAISTDDVSNIVLLFPPKSDQIQIVEYLNKATSKIDKTIQKIDKKITLLEEYKKSLIHHVVTGKVEVRKSEV